VPERGWTGPGVADGLYGPKTEKGTEQFQNEKPSTSDGLVGVLGHSTGSSRSKV